MLRDMTQEPAESGELEARCTECHSVPNYATFLLRVSLKIGLAMARELFGVDLNFQEPAGRSISVNVSQRVNALLGPRPVTCLKESCRFVGWSVGFSVSLSFSLSFSLSLFLSLSPSLSPSLSLSFSLSLCVSLCSCIVCRRIRVFVCPSVCVCVRVRVCVCVCASLSVLCLSLSVSVCLRLCLSISSPLLPSSFDIQLFYPFTVRASQPSQSPQGQ